MFGQRCPKPARLVIILVFCQLLILPVTALTPAFAASGLTVHDLRVGNTANPLAVDDPRPALSWRLRSGKRGDRQTAYRVLVASRPEILAGRRADVWDSGKVSSADSVAIPYGGPKLMPAHRYYWTVQTWDVNGRPSSPARTAWWETGLFGAAGWAGAQWVTPDTGNAYTWQDLTVEADVTIKSGAASILFRAKDSDTFAMWQINAVTTPGKVLLRPHTRTRGSYSLLGEVDLSPVLTPSNVAAPHRVRIRAQADTITTWIDEVQVDVRSVDMPGQGTIGFRSSVSQGVPEIAQYDNLVVRDLAGKVLFSDDFSASPDPRFPGVPITDGRLEPRATRHCSRPSPTHRCCARSSSSTDRWSAPARTSTASGSTNCTSTAARSATTS
ncbi:glycoside hydrolase family 78 protein [Lentzea indica]|uniref:glycoside hydrolase family 78 protein n=1 Tax=Lentzea indica TaxID=2604800 RepID=UPI001FE3FEF8|nr:hypothetical protein [Lentzea indica]